VHSRARSLQLPSLKWYSRTRSTFCRHRSLSSPVFTPTSSYLRRFPGDALCASSSPGASSSPWPLVGAAAAPSASALLSFANEPVVPADPADLSHDGAPPLAAALKRPADEDDADAEALVAEDGAEAAVEGDEEAVLPEPAEDASHAGGAVVAPVDSFAVSEDDVDGPDPSAEPAEEPDDDAFSHAGGSVVAPPPPLAAPRPDAGALASPLEAGPESHDDVAPTLLVAVLKKLGPPLVLTLVVGFLASHPGTSPPDAAAAKVVLPKVGALEAAASAPTFQDWTGAEEELSSSAPPLGRCFFGLGPPS
jgi:hypothetical protein